VWARVTRGRARGVCQRSGMRRARARTAVRPRTPPIAMQAGHSHPRGGVALRLHPPPPHTHTRRNRARAPRRAAPRTCVAVLDARHLQHLLGRARRDDACAARRWDEADGHAAALAGHLGGHCVHLANLVAPIAAAHGDDRHLGQDDGAADGGGHLAARWWARVCLCVGGGGGGMGGGGVSGRRGS
jgi:hypothetical protein